MSITAAAIPVVGDIVKTALPVVGDIVKSIAPLVKPFTDALAKKIAGEEPKPESTAPKLTYTATEERKITYDFQKSA